MNKTTTTALLSLAALAFVASEAPAQSNTGARTVAMMLQNMENNVNQLNARVRYLQDYQAELVRGLKETQSALARSQNQNANFQRQIDDLRRQMVADRAQFQAGMGQMNQMADKVARETGKTVESYMRQQQSAVKAAIQTSNAAAAAANANAAALARAQAAAQAQAQAANAAAEKSGPAGSGKFEEYVVQSGASLNAIAKAYQVGVDDICKANRIKRSTALKVGQKLYIPLKK